MNTWTLTISARNREAGTSRPLEVVHAVKTSEKYAVTMALYAKYESSYFVEVDARKEPKASKPVSVEED